MKINICYVCVYIYYVYIYIYYVYYIYIMYKYIYIIYKRHEIHEKVGFGVVSIYIYVLMLIVVQNN